MTTAQTKRSEVKASSVERPFVYLVGQGSSGTKRIFNLLDLSRQTHCRMGHQRSARSPFRELGGEWVLTETDAEALERSWSDALEWAASHFSDTDLMPPPPKDHLSETARRLGLWSWVRGARSKRLLGLLIPELRSEEWLLPRLFGDRDRMKAALLVLKHNQVPGWASWALRERPRAVVLHVLRHPGGYLNAWRGRFQEHQDQDALALANRERLHSIASVSESWCDRFGEIDRMCAAEAELWFWRFAAESLEDGGAGEPRYLHVLDEEMLDQPLETAARIYEHCGLPMPEGVNHWIDRMAQPWQEASRPWRELLSDADIALVERIVGPSPTWSWWRPDQRVSLFNYVAFDPGRG